jgi:glycosyltransferase involved in cell wall biosynthesis
LVEPKNISDWVEKIKYIFEHQDESKQLAKNAQKYAKDNFSVELMVKKYDEVYSLVANK